jgi:hypothetical protein
MRKSTRLLGICVLYSFAVSVCLIVTLRLLYVYKPYGAEEEGSSGSREEARSDSIRAMGPGEYYALVQDHSRASKGRPLECE